MRSHVVSLVGLAALVAAGCVGDEADPTPGGGGADAGDGGACSPVTCASAGKTCGSISNGCGEQIACGDCAAPDTCGGAGTANVCGRPAGNIASVTVGDRTDKQLRQGTPSGITVKIVAAGANLEGATTATIETTPPIVVPVAAAESTAATVTFYVSVPHGATVGAAALSITTPRGSARLADAITITAITAAAATGNDTTGDGTTAKPFKTYKHSLLQAAEGDTIFLDDGTYDAANGEAWPIITSTAYGAYDAPANVPSRVTVKGKSTIGTKIVGAGASATPLRMGLVSKPGAGGSGSIESLTIAGFPVGILAVGSALAVKDVVVELGSDNVYARGDSKVTLTNSVLRTAGSSGLSAWDTASATFTGGRISQNGLWGIYSTTSGTLTLTGTEVDENDFSANTGNDAGGILATGFDTKTVGAITLTNVNSHDNKRNGVDVRQSSGTTNVTITGSQFRREKVYALGAGNNVKVKIRNTTFELPTDGTGACQNSAIYFGGTSELDLGTAAEMGTNTFTLAATGACFGLVDVRPATAPTPVTLSNTTFTNTAIPIKPAAGCSAATNDRKWYIETPGTCPSTGNVIVAY